MDKQQEQRFAALLHEKAAQAKRDLRYPATQFLNMIANEGAFLATKKLLAKSPTEGFTKLLLAKRLDLSLEAVVVESEWRKYFDDSLVTKATKLLRDAGYDAKPFASSTASINVISIPPIEQSPQPTRLDEQGRFTRKNTLSFSDLCRDLGAPLANIQDRWCGVSDEKKLAVFTVWVDRLIDGRYVFWDDGKSPLDTRIGARELGRVIKTVMDKGYSAYGILCEAEDATAHPRKRKYFQEDKLLVLSFADEPPGTVAYVRGEISTASIKVGLRHEVGPFQSAEEDLDNPPTGSETPGKVTRSTSGYRRDPDVRSYVISRAKGKCEYCGVEGFLLPNTTRYLEAHHVIALAARGPDTIYNVIALCPGHHREAHYGKDAADLEERFLKLLPSLNKESTINA